MLSISPPRAVAAILDETPTADSPAFDGRLHRATVRSVFGMGLPSMASFLLLTIYDLIDIYWLARLGEAPVAADTIVGALFWVVNFPNQIIGTGSVSLISRRFGAGDHAKTESAIKNTFFGKFLVGVVMGTIGWFLCPQALTWMGAEPEVRDLGVAYGRVQFVVMAISLMSFSVYTALRGIGRPRYGMYVSIAGAFVNLLLDPLLIFGIGPFPRLGVVGASLASAAGFLTVTVWGMVALSSAGSPVRVRWFARPWFSLEELRRMGRIGLPSGFASLSMALFSSALVKLVAVYGTTVVAVFGMSNKVLQFGRNLVSGLGLGTSALVGQHLGARDLSRAWATAIVTIQIATGILVVFAAFVFLFAEPIAAVFFADPDVVTAAVPILRWLALGLPFVGAWVGAEQAYVGAGRTVPPLVAQAINSWIITVPAMWFLGQTLGLGATGMMIAVSAGQLIGAILGFVLLRRGSWLLHEV